MEWSAQFVTKRLQMGKLQSDWDAAIFFIQIAFSSGLHVKSIALHADITKPLVYYDLDLYVLLILKY